MPRREFATDIGTHNASNLTHWNSLIRLRWFAVLAQALTGWMAVELFHMPIPQFEFILVLAIEVVANLLATRLRYERSAPSNRLLALFMLLDLNALTALLFLTGGTANPFNFLFLIHIALAAVFLPRQWLYLVVGSAILSFGLLFIAPPMPSRFGVFGRAAGVSLAPDGADWSVVQAGLSPHHWGMWLAFAIAAISIAFFVSRLVQELRRREQAQRVAEELSNRSTRLASLAALAAGAAHELATPLSTIALVASDLADIEAKHLDIEDTRQDAQLIRSEVRRCREILDRLAADAGEARATGYEPTDLKQFWKDVEERVRQPERIRLDRERLSIDTLQYQVRPLVHALTAVVDNALRATPDGQFIDVELRNRNEELRISVRDQGKGMTPQVLARATEPFFSDRPEGEGMGLGLFLARNVCETLGGQLDIQSIEGDGTTVTFRLPLNPPIQQPTSSPVRP